MSGSLIIKNSVNIFASGKRKWCLSVCGGGGEDHYGGMIELVESARHGHHRYRRRCSHSGSK